MNVWESLKKAVRENGVRVEQRLALLEKLHDPDCCVRLQDDLEEARRRLDAAANQLRREAMER